MAGVFIVLSIIGAGLYTVDETQQAVITQFGDFKRVVKDAGLHFKMPVMEQAKLYDKRVLEWDGKAEQMSTVEKQLISVDVFARWKIVDPRRFLEEFGDEARAHGRLDDVINSAVRNQISKNSLIEVVRSSNRPMESIVDEEGEAISEAVTIIDGRDVITRRILTEARRSTKQYGIELLDIQIKAINYLDEVRKRVYERMVAERRRIAAKYRSEGEGKMKEILGQKEYEEKESLSSAYKEAQGIMGQADAEAIRIYAEAYSKDPEFYSFMKTLESYKDNLGGSGVMIMSTDNEYLKYLDAAVNIDNQSK